MMQTVEATSQRIGDAMQDLSNDSIRNLLYNLQEIMDGTKENTDKIILTVKVVTSEYHFPIEYPSNPPPISFYIYRE